MIKEYYSDVKCRSIGGKNIFFFFFFFSLNMSAVLVGQLISRKHLRQLMIDPHSYIQQKCKYCKACKYCEILHTINKEFICGGFKSFNKEHKWWSISSRGDLLIIKPSAIKGLPSLE